MKIARRALSLVVLLVVLDLFFGIGGLVEAPLHFVFGWIFSIVRLAPQFQFSSALAWWIAGLVAFVLLLAWFWAGFDNARPRWRLVSAFTGICFCVILAGMSLAGSVHQLAWLAASDESWFGWGFNGRRAALLEAASVAGHLVEKTSTRQEWENAWRGLLEDGAPDRGQPDFHSRFATHLRTARNGTIDEVVLWPRNGDDFRKFGGMIVGGRSAQKTVSRENLLTYLQTQPKADHER